MVDIGLALVAWAAFQVTFAVEDTVQVGLTSTEVDTVLVGQIILVASSTVVACLVLEGIVASVVAFPVVIVAYLAMLKVDNPLAATLAAFQVASAVVGTVLVALTFTGVDTIQVALAAFQATSAEVDIVLVDLASTAGEDTILVGQILVVVN